MNTARDREPADGNDDVEVKGSVDSDQATRLNPAAGVEPVLDAPQALLNRLRDASRERGNIRIPASRRRAPGGTKRKYTVDGIYTGRDPEGLGSVFTRMLSDRGWNSPVAVGSVMARWEELVGPEISAHCRPESFDGQTVIVRCDSTTWAAQLRLMSLSLLQRFDAELGPAVVTKISVLGPSAPSWKKGNRSVAGRGPRDTYG